MAMGQSKMHDCAYSLTSSLGNTPSDSLSFSRDNTHILHISIMIADKGKEENTELHNFEHW